MSGITGLFSPDQGLGECCRTGSWRREEDSNSRYGVAAEFVGLRSVHLDPEHVLLSLPSDRQRVDLLHAFARKRERLPAGDDLLDEVRWEKRQVDGAADEVR